MDTIKLKASIWDFLALINIFALDAVPKVANWTLPTLPGTIGKTGALGSREAGVGQAPINWAGFFVAHLSVYGITNTLFTTMLCRWIVTQTLTSLDATPAGESAQIPG